MWQNQSGVARGLDHSGVVRFGLVGSSDIVGLTNDGRFLALEVKTGDAVQRASQIRFMMMIYTYGGRYRVVRSVDDATKFLDSLRLTK